MPAYDVVATIGFSADFQQLQNIMAQVHRTLGQVSAQVSPVVGNVQSLNAALASVVAQARQAQAAMGMATGQALAFAQGASRLQQNLNQVAQASTRVRRESVSAFVDTASAIERAIGKVLIWAAATTAVYGTLRSIREGVRYFLDFEQAVARVNRVMELSGEELNNLRSTVSTFISQHAISARDLLQIFYQLGEANFTYTQALQLYEPIAKTVIATEEDSAEVARALAQAYINLGHTVRGATNERERMQRVADILLYTATREIASLEFLREGLRYVQASAAQTNVSFDELIAMLGVLNTAGLEATTAGQTLNMMMTQMARNAEDLSRVLGITFDPKKPLDVVKVLEQAHRKLGDGTLSAQALAAVMGIFEQRAARAFLTLVREFPRLREAIDEIGTRSEGTTERMASAMENTIPGALRKVGNAFAEVFRTFFDNLVGREGVVEALNRLSNSLLQLREDAKNVATQLKFLWQDFKTFISTIGAPFELVGRLFDWIGRTLGAPTEIVANVARRIGIINLRDLEQPRPPIIRSLVIPTAPARREREGPPTTLPEPPVMVTPPRINIREEVRALREATDARREYADALRRQELHQRLAILALGAERTRIQEISVELRGIATQRRMIAQEIERENRAWREREAQLLPRGLQAAQQQLEQMRRQLEAIERQNEARRIRGEKITASEAERQRELLERYQELNRAVNTYLQERSRHEEHLRDLSNQQLQLLVRERELRQELIQIQLQARQRLEDFIQDLSLQAEGATQTERLKIQFMELASELLKAGASFAEVLAKMREFDVIVERIESRERARRIAELEAEVAQLQGRQFEARRRRVEVEFEQRMREVRTPEEREALERWRAAQLEAIERDRVRMIEDAVDEIADIETKGINARIRQILRWREEFINATGDVELANKLVALRLSEVWEDWLRRNVSRLTDFTTALAVLARQRLEEIGTDAYVWARATMDSVRGLFGELESIAVEGLTRLFGDQRTPVARLFSAILGPFIRAQFQLWERQIIQRFFPQLEAAQPHAQLLQASVQGAQMYYTQIVSASAQGAQMFAQAIASASATGGPFRDILPAGGIPVPATAPQPTPVPVPAGAPAGGGFFGALASFFGGPVGMILTIGSLLLGLLTPPQPPRPQLPEPEDYFPRFTWGVPASPYPLPASYYFRPANMVSVTVNVSGALDKKETAREIVQTLRPALEEYLQERHRFGIRRYPLVEVRAV